MRREIKFRAWDKDKKIMIHDQDQKIMDYYPEIKIGSYIPYSVRRIGELYGTYMQFTGLHDKNGVTEIYEGDIIDSQGNIKGNIYESPQIYEEGIDILIEGLGTKKWRNTESVAMGRGCKYAE